ncbi:MAG: sensor histidine kinase [Thermoanaerobaculia bacterium]
MRAARERVTRAYQEEWRSGHATLLMDSTRLAHAIQNVIINAIQYAPAESEVTVSLSPVQHDTRGAVECIVGDAGPGFQTRDLPRIFQPFFTRRRGGTGLGLSIVQRVIDEHGGSVFAENAASGGAVVRMRFPLFGQHPSSSAPKDVP